MQHNFDVIVIGSGHNGLTSACYLAKAGYNVGVFERRDNIGGAVCTETMFESDEYPGGFRIDVGSSAHFMIHQTPVIQDLELEKYGLKYIEMDPFMSYPLPEGKGVIHFHRDLDKTLASIEKVAPEDVENYRNFIEFWTRINRGVLKAFLVPPAPGKIVTEVIKGQLRDGAMFKKGEQTEALRRIFGSYYQEVNEQFESPYIKAAILWFAAQSGPVPEQSATGAFAGWQAMLHESGGKRPEGGSGMLTQAMAKMLRAHGGQVFTDASVANIIIENNNARGIKLENGQEYKAKVVISNAHVQTTMMKMVGKEFLKPEMLKRVEHINTGNGFGMVIRCAVEELPKYTACPDDTLVHNGLQLLVPSYQHMQNSIADYMKGHPPERPSVLAMTFSNIDKTLAPDGKHIMFVWAQWHPYKLADGLHWDDIKEKEAQKIYDEVVRYAPNMKGKVIDWYIQTPLDIERKHGMINGNVMHVEMTFDQMFMFRPTPGMSNYETPIKNLFLSSASCHPGGGVFAAAGHNAGKVVLKYLRKKKWL